MLRKILVLLLVCSCTLKSSDKDGNASLADEGTLQAKYPDAELLNRKGDGYLGLWYMNGKLDSEYQFKYSGGLGTYCAKHNPFAVYSEEAQKTFFCFGGTTEGAHLRNDLTAKGKDVAKMPGVLFHMVAYYDHGTGKLSRPAILLDKYTCDTHDNPVISLDDQGYIWIFSTSHGTLRNSYIHKSREPYNIDEFVRIAATKLENGVRVPMDNFSYLQTWFVEGEGFISFFTSYRKNDLGLGQRTINFMSSKDGKDWSEWTNIAAIAEGHYQISAYRKGKAASAFNYHPPRKDGKGGLNYRTNLYYVETTDFGKTWQSAGGTSINLPLLEPDNAALVWDYEKEGLLVYMKDIYFDEDGNPVILFVTSKGAVPGPENAPRTWRIARWTGSKWVINEVTTSDNNYDMGSLYLHQDVWRIVAPTGEGPQTFNPGGEMVMWESRDQGQTWEKRKQLTYQSKYNHSYARRPVNAHPDFYALWADGHGREPSESRLYFANMDGEVYQLPTSMDEDMEAPAPLKASTD